MPGVAVNSYHGMREVVTHLARAHGRSRLAFIRGPERHQEAEERYRAYVDVLADHSIPLRAGLVVIGNLKELGRAEAVQVLLGERRARFDALVAASDNMAIGAMKALQARGLHIPGDLAVAGDLDIDRRLLVAVAGVPYERQDLTRMAEPAATLERALLARAGLVASHRCLDGLAHAPIGARISVKTPVGAH